MSESLLTVQYRDIPEFPGYRVGDDGSVWSCRRSVRIPGLRGSGSAIGTEWKRLKPAPNSWGYLGVTLCRDGKRYTNMIHAVAALAFLGPCPEGQQVLHGDGNQLNNSISNLRHGTPKDNHDDSKLHGTHCHGERHGMSKLTEEDVRSIRAAHAAGENPYAISKRLKMSNFAIRRIVFRKGWTHVA